MPIAATSVLKIFLFTCLSILLTEFAHASEGSSLIRRLRGENENPIESRTFTPHLTIDSRTRPIGKVSLQRAPGANINTGMLLSSFVVAVAPRIELGTMPVFYTDDIHRYNINVKWNFWRDDLIDWAFGYSLFDSRLTRDESDIEQGRNLSLKNSASQISFNFHPQWTRFSLSAAYTVALTKITGDEALAPYATRQVSDFACDLSYPVGRRVDLTVGGGTIRELGFTAYEDRKFGFGPSTGIYFPQGFVSKLTIGGHYIPSTGKTQALLGIKFL